MRFIRENLFLLILIGIVVVISGMVIAINFGVGGDVDKRIKEREKLAGSLRGFAGASKYNQAIVDAERQRVNMVRHEANRAVADQVQRNRQANAVLIIPITEFGIVTKVVPAFPIDAREYKKWGLALIFVNRHYAATGEALKRLHPTRPPTDGDIETETERVKGRMRREASTRPAAEATAPLSEIIPAHAGPVQGVEDEAKRRATDRMIHLRATQGRIYVDNAVPQEITFGAGETRPDEITLWRKQYKLWISKDVVAAIKATNDAVLNGLPQQDRNVLNAAVKRWTDLKIADDYFVRKTREGAPATPMHTPTVVPTPGRMPDTEYMRDRPGPGRPGPGWPGPGIPSPRTMAPTGQAETSITQRYTSLESDVVHYSFSVVMPNRHLLLLIKKLQAGRMHTVMTVGFSPLPKVEAGNFYYYGNDPVLLVTLSCEAQLLTSWSRDLMPLAFLQTIPSSALREKDLKRIPLRSALMPR